MPTVKKQFLHGEVKSEDNINKRNLLAWILTSAVNTVVKHSIDIIIQVQEQHILFDWVPSFYIDSPGK